MERIKFFTKLSEDKVDGLPAYEGTAMCEGMDMPISMANSIMQIRANEAYVELAESIKIHQLVTQTFFKREAEALERIAKALEKPVTFTPELIGGRE